MQNFADRLMAAMDQKRSCLCVGLDPQWERLPRQLREEALERYGRGTRAAAEAYLEFSRRVLSVVAPLVPAVKVQGAFFEEWGSAGMASFYQVVRAARDAGLLVIADVKRGDVPHTAAAYARAYLGAPELDGALEEAALGADAVTINPYLGSDSVQPFLDLARATGRGLFILVKSSNPSSGELQDWGPSSQKLYQRLADLVWEWAKSLPGERGYSAVGAVVGATYPQELSVLRREMPESFFLLPGYGAQGARAEDVVSAFNEDGYGALVNASRSIIFAGAGSGASWEEAVASACRRANEEINAALERRKTELKR